jgi:hypothetical protein
MTPRRARNDMIDASDAAEQIENADATDAIEPTETAEPIEPIDSTEPREPIDSSEPSDQSDHFELPGDGLSPLVSRMIAAARVMLLDRAPVASAALSMGQPDASAASSSSSVVICSRAG